MIPTTESVTTLAKRWAAGDRRAGSELIVKHDGWIRAYARRKALPWEDVDDVAQIMRIAFIHAAGKAAPVYSDTETRFLLRRNMLGSLRNERHCALRRRLHDQDTFDEEDDDSGLEPSQEATVFAGELIRLSGLTRNDAAVLQMRVFDEMLEQEVAAELHRPNTTVCRWLASAMRKVKSAAGVSLVKVEHRPICRRAPTDETDRRIRDFLSRNGPTSRRMIQESLGMTYEVCRKSLDRMRVKGDVLADGPTTMATLYVLRSEAQPAA